MSRRVTTQTEIKDRDLALSAFQTAGVRFRDCGDDVFEISAGNSTAHLDLKSGIISGDDMRWKQRDFDTLKQHYGEQAYLWQLRKRGATLQKREVDKDGNIVLIYQTTG